MAKIENIFVKFGNTTSIVSRYCSNCGFDRNRHDLSALKFGLCFGESIVCRECHQSEKIIKMDCVPEEEIELKIPKETSLEEKLKLHDLILFQIDDPQTSWFNLYKPNQEG